MLMWQVAHRLHQPALEGNTRQATTNQRHAARAQRDSQPAAQRQQALTTAKVSVQTCGGVRSERQGELDLLL